MRNPQFNDPMISTSGFTDHEAAEQLGFEPEELVEVEIGNLILDSYGEDSN